MHYSNKLNRSIISLLSFTRFATLSNFSFYDPKLQIYPSIVSTSRNFFFFFTLSFFLSFLPEVYFQDPDETEIYTDTSWIEGTKLTLWRCYESYGSTQRLFDEGTRFLIKNLAEKPVASRRSIPLVFLSFLVSRFSVNRRIFVKFWHEECFAGAERRPRGRLFVLPARNANLPMSRLPLVLPFCILRAMVPWRFVSAVLTLILRIYRGQRGPREILLGCLVWRILN